jgi:hypothetical protein
VVSVLVRERAGMAFIAGREAVTVFAQWHKEVRGPACGARHVAPAYGL